ncbi:hypothetical protein K466DRAFT_590219 [Polyporus arcularius HHB13444]|uniref:Uncharacterized protein n=1 Tax=Polyporus arcularius HHB13444 TaxID=1314778 RepID=A0A5C3P2M2_9APHY|nr:hypothetical protein K466DRAFT_590219 [Polyporus arcularius HHB13444]
MRSLPRFPRLVRLPSHPHPTPHIWHCSSCADLVMIYTPPVTGTRDARALYGTLPGLCTPASHHTQFTHYGRISWRYVRASRDDDSRLYAASPRFQRGCGLPGGRALVASCWWGGGKGGTAQSRAQGRRAMSFACDCLCLLLHYIYSVPPRIGLFVPRSSSFLGSLGLLALSSL